MKISRRLLATILGLVFAFGVAELVFRLAGRLHFSDVEITKRIDEEFRIIALGNSHTYGFGVPRGKAYADVLDQFLRSERPGFPVKVINHGIGNANTYHVQRHLEKILPIERPNLVLMMVGEPNFWSKEGYESFLIETEGYISNVSSALIRLLSHFRLFRWLLMLRYQFRSEEANPEYALEKEAYFLLGKHFYLLRGKDFHPIQAKNIKETFSQYLKKTKEHPPLAIREFLLTLARVEWIHYKNYQKAVELLEQSLRIHPLRRNPLTAVAIGIFYHTTKDPAARKAIQILQDSVIKEFTPDERKKYVDLFVANNNNLSQIKQSIPFYDETRKLIPAATYLHLNLVEYYREQGNLKKAIEVASELLGANPIQHQSVRLYSFFSSKSMASYPDDVRKIALDAREQFIRRFPTETYLMESYDDEKVEKWVEWSIGKIGDISRRANAEVVVQNYHWLRDNYPQNRVLSAVEKGARDHGLRYLEQAKIFRQELGTDEESYYIKALGPVARDNHPSEKGHRLIARIIYDYLNSNKLLPVELQNLDSKKLYQFKHER